MLEALGTFALAAGAVVVAGTFLTKFADDLAEATKLGRLLVGSIMLAGATSLPELMLDIHAVRNGWPNLAVGDLFGSSLFNLLILAILDHLHSKPGLLFSREVTHFTLPAVFSLIMTAAALIGTFLAKEFAGWQVLSLGIGSWMVLATYLMGVRITYYDQPPQDESYETEDPPKTVWIPLAGFAVCAAVIAIAAPFATSAAALIADQSGLGKSFVGTTLVALTTSLPELVSTYVAVRMGAWDLAVGNIFGSNAFNMVLLLPLDALDPKDLLGSVDHIHLLTAAAAIFATGIAIAALVYRGERSIGLFEPGGRMVVIVVVATLVLLYFLSGEGGHEPQPSPPTPPPAAAPASPG